MAGEVRIEGTTFVLTGKMWQSRQAVAHEITSAGGFVGERITHGLHVLVFADGANRDTGKFNQARDKRSSMVHEHALRAALDLNHRMVPTIKTSPVRAHAPKLPKVRCDKSGPCEAHPDCKCGVYGGVKESEAARARMVANLDETSKLLGSF